MKYEIIKGSEKDFEGAPEWAMLRLLHISGNSVSAESLNMGAKRTAMLTDKIVYISSPSEWKIIAERRPITEPVVNQQLTTEWGEDGLPPVGVWCEILWNDDWVKCVVKAYGEEQLIFKAEGSREWAGHINNYKFRPIRLPEDVARDEAIAKMFSILYEGTSTQDDARDIYDAIAAGKIPGITKTPTVSELMRVTENATREDCEAIVKMLSGK